jgi:ribosomal protein S18 acetylase RimI-like enzyme
VSTLAGLRRATAADVDAVTALQRAAYARNREILGVEPLPLQADYDEVVAHYEVWLAEGDGLEGVLILEQRPDDLLIWSVATHPQVQGRRLGRRLLAAAEDRAAALGKRVMRLYTGEPLTGNIAWYRRHGYAVERVEQMPDRRAVHMVKVLDETDKDGRGPQPHSNGGSGT